MQECLGNNYWSMGHCGLFEGVPCKMRLKIWGTFLRVFGRSPYGLFTWGLRMSLIRDSSTTDSCENLLVLLPRPIWEGKLHLLRYFLQISIYLRVQDHIRPISPLSKGSIIELE